MYDTTSDMRQAVCAAICGHVHRSDKQTKQWLADTLAVQPFEAMNDEALVRCAYDAGVDPEIVGRLVSEKSHEARPVRARYLCGLCLDSHVVQGVGGGFVQCPRCTVPRMVEPPL